MTFSGVFVPLITPFDADDAVIAWTGFLTGHPGEPRTVAPFVNDGSAVFALPEQLLGELCDATAGALRSAADVWHTDLLQDDDMYAANTLEHRERVGVRGFEGVEIVEGTLVLELPRLVVGGAAGAVLTTAIPCGTIGWSTS